MKKICFLLVLVVVFSFFEFASFADDYDLLSVAEVVKQKVDIPEHYTDFSSYVNVGASVNYVLSWSGGDSSDGGVVTVVTDTKNRIVSLSQYKYGKYQGNYKLSSIDYNDAARLAARYIKKLAPEFADRLVLFPQANYIVRNNESYQVVFYRYENGLPCYDNYAVVLIDAYTKQVSEYRAVWEDYVKISPAGSYISKEQALKIYNNQIGIQHAYSKCGDEIKIVYSTNSDGTKFVNAYNGQITNTNLPVYPSADKYKKKTYLTHDLTELYDGRYQLPDITDDKVNDNPYFSITADYEMESSKLYADGEGNTFARLVYNNYTNAPITVILDTKNTEIVGYSAPRKNTDNSKMLTDSECLKIASGFAQRYVNSIYKKCRSAEKIETEDKNIYRAKYPLYVNGIPYLDNGIIIDIDRADGRVISVDAKMDANAQLPLSIPDTSYDKAYDVLVNEIGFVPQYVPVMTTEGKELRVVYSFVPVYPVYVCGKTGLTCDKDGNVYQKPEEKVYNDIAHSASKDMINTLVLADIMKYDGDSFYPEQYVTTYEFMQIVYRAFGKIIEFDSYDSYITHESAIEKLINVLGYGDIAYLADTYVNDFVDGSSVSPELAGCAAIAKGLGIIKGNAFLPKENVTRAYCAELIYNTITERTY